MEIRCKTLHTTLKGANICNPNIIHPHTCYLCEIGWLYNKKPVTYFPIRLCRDDWIINNDPKKGWWSITCFRCTKTVLWSSAGIVFMLSQASLHHWKTKPDTSYCGRWVIVGMTGFEPAASSSRTTRATGLRYIPLLLTKNFFGQATKIIDVNKIEEQQHSIS